ncbi:hypothetical protein XENOCAPTIV_024310 [Xenoophorus captivus]|uniref:Secreted protein n=1 Tax=Xenoophorus captivus TaxID=1517983 RepID=A0ABV0RRY3_9TELE
MSFSVRFSDTYSLTVLLRAQMVSVVWGSNDCVTPFSYREPSTGGFSHKTCCVRASSIARFLSLCRACGGTQPLPVEGDKPLRKGTCCTLKLY